MRILWSPNATRKPILDYIKLTILNLLNLYNLFQFITQYKEVIQR